MALIDKASLLFVPSVVAEGKAFNVLPSGNRAPDSTDQNSGYDQTRADFDFDRGSNAAATRIGSDGLIKKYRENLLLQSNQFDTTWTKSSSVLTLTDNQSGYDGSSNAWKLESTSSISSLSLSQTIASSGVQVFSVYAKAGSIDWVRINLSGVGNRFFDISNGVVGSTGSLEGTITSVGNGWYRISILGVGSSSAPLIFPSSNDDDTTLSNGDYIFIQNAQLESGLVSTDYLDSTSVTGKAGVLVDLPRINYDANGENGSLLLEPSRANLVQYSEYFGSGYTLSSTAIISNNTTSPEGLQNATKLYPTASGNYRNIRYGSLSPSTGLHTFSIFAKAGELEHLVLIDYDGGGVGIDFDLSTGVATDSATIAFDFVDMVDYGNGWYRCIATATSPYFYWILSDNGGLGVTANGTDGLYIWGAQAESNASYPSSYIPNHGESGGVTRAADSCSVTGASDVIGQTEGTLFIEAENNPSAYLFAAPNNVIFGSINSGNYLNNFHFTTDASKIYVYCNSGGTLYASPGTTLPSSSTLKMAVTYTSSAIKFFLNGVLVGTDTSFNLPVGMNQIDVGHMGGQPATQKMRGGIDKFIVFTEAITDAEAITLTTL